MIELTELKIKIPDRGLFANAPYWSDEGKVEVIMKTIIELAEKHNELIDELINHPNK